MGYLDQLRENIKVLNSTAGGPRRQPQGPDLWSQAFGKEDRLRSAMSPRDDGGTSQGIPQNSWGRSTASTPAAIKRLLQALRSMAPGGWSDDRWEQTQRHFVGIGYVAIHRKAKMMAQSEFQIFRKAPGHPDGKIPVQEGDPAYDLVRLLEKPNPLDTFGDLMYRWQQQKDLTGSALTWMVPNLFPNVHPDPIYYGLGTPHELYSIPTAMAIPQPAVNPDYPDGYYRIQPVYPYGPFSSYPTPASAVGAPIPAQWMIRFQYPHPILRYDGYSPLTGMRLEMDSLDSVNRSRWYNMKRTYRPNVVMTSDDQEGSEPLPDPEIDRIRAMIEQAFQSPENVGGLLVPPPGWRVEEFGQRPVDMDYPSGWDQLLNFILGGFGITKPAAGMVEDSAYATLFATLKQLHLITLEPECNDIAAKLTRFLAPFFGSDLIIEIRCKRIDDHDITFNKIQVAQQAKAIKKNQVLKLLELPVTAEPWGEDMAGDPTPLELAMMQQDQMMQMAMGGMPPEDGGEGGGMQSEEEMMGEEEGGIPSEDQPGELGKGALGPRKSLTPVTNRLKIDRKSLTVKPVKKAFPKKRVPEQKSFYERVREVIRNGH